MQTTPENLIRALNGWIEAGTLRKDEPIFALLISREDLTEVAQWHEELSQFHGELPNLKDEDLEFIFSHLEDNPGTDLIDNLGKMASHRLNYLRQRDERYKLYLELQREFGEKRK